MRERRLAGGLLTLLLLLLLFASAPPQAGAFGFLKLGDIKGESTDDDHPNEIDIGSISWGLTQQSSRGGSAGSTTGKVNVQDFSFVKRVDRSSPLLMAATASGRQFPCATVTLKPTRPKGDREPSPLLVYKLQDVLVTSYQTSAGAGDDVPTDQFSLNFARIDFEYSRPGGAEDTPTTARWDFLHRVPFDESDPVC